MIRYLQVMERLPKMPDSLVLLLILSFIFFTKKNDLLRIVVLTVKSLGGPKSCFSRYWQQILKIAYTLFSLQTG